MKEINEKNEFFLNCMEVQELTSEELQNIIGGDNPFYDIGYWLGGKLVQGAKGAYWFYKEYLYTEDYYLYM